jgi:hypothetical protein
MEKLAKVVELLLFQFPLESPERPNKNITA